MFQHFLGSIFSHGEEMCQIQLFRPIQGLALLAGIFGCGCLAVHQIGSCEAEAGHGAASAEPTVGGKAASIDKPPWMTLGGDLGKARLFNLPLSSREGEEVGTLSSIF